MTVSELITRAGFTAAALPEPELEIESCYAGDLLSWVMGNASRGCAWVTIMTNRNTVAVASLIEMACIILAEGCVPDEDLAQLAVDQRINILCAPTPIYETCAALAQIL